MEKTVHRIGIVGANSKRGWAHDAHIPALKNMPQFKLEAVSARTQELAEEARAAFGATRAFGDSLDMVRDPNIDIVTVTVKVPEHRAVVLAALAAGKHVYCEWPLGRDLSEAVEMADVARSANHVMIGLQSLSSPAVRLARKLVQDGALGRLNIVRVFSPTAGWGKQAPPFYAYLQDKRNGATLEAIAGGHTLALIEYIVGSYIEVDARNTTLQKKIEIMGTGETVQRSCADHMLVVGLHEGGCVSTLEVAGGIPDRPFRFELVGEAGTLVLSSKHPGGFQVGAISLETSVAAAPLLQASLPDLIGAPVNVSEGYLRLASDIESGVKTVPDFEYAVQLTRLLDVIDAASVSGQRQIVPQGN